MGEIPIPATEAQITAFLCANSILSYICHASTLMRQSVIIAAFNAKRRSQFRTDPFVTQLFKPMPLRMKVRGPRPFQHLYLTVAAENRS